MSKALETVARYEPFIRPFIDSVIGENKDFVIDAFARVADLANDQIEKTPIQLDDDVKEVLIEALEAAIEQLRVDGVDDDFGDPEPTD